MTPEHIRQLYDYHFTINRKLWDQGIMALDEARFTQPLDYSIGSIHHQMVHMMSVERRWFGGLCGDAELPPHADPADYSDRPAIRTEWDAVEAKMRDYLAALTDAEINRPFTDQFQVWQVLLHVVNHATDHRAQVLAALNGMGVETFPQDYVYYLLGRM